MALGDLLTAGEKELHVCATHELVPIPMYMLEEYIDSAETHPAEFRLDQQGRVCFMIDSCIADTMRAVFAAGVRTTGCCCGHGSGRGVISLETRVYDSGVIPEQVCTHEGTPRATVCEVCWTAVVA